MWLCVLQGEKTEMANADDSYLQLLAEYRKRDNYDSVFRSTLDNLAGKVDFSWVRSCVAFGTGSGEHEIEFIRRFMPNLRAFIAIEPDHESVKALRENFRSDPLPGVETTVVEMTAQDWNGADEPVDAALSFNTIFHVESAGRQQLLQKLRTQYLTHNGVVVIIENASPITFGYIRLMHRLGYPQDNWYHDIEKEVLAAGFRLESIYDIVSTRDLSNPSESVVKYIELLFDNKFSRELVHAVIAEIYNDPTPDVLSILRKIAIFKNSP